jgi:hypothetical protein
MAKQSSKLLQKLKIAGDAKSKKKFGVQFHSGAVLTQERRGEGRFDGG